METIILMILTFAGYLAAYKLYGKFLSNKIFQLSDDNITPSVKSEDGQDYVPTKKGVIFGHHYTSIAGTGPIVGPAIGIIWGWVPALIWVFVGSIVMGAVHDFGTLVISLRNEGKSISDCTGKLINSRVKHIFFIIIFLALIIVIAIFCLVIAIIFKLYAGAVFPVWCQIPIAIALGWIVYKKKGNLTLFTALAVILMYLTVVAGHWMQLSLPDEGLFGIPPTGVWAVILLTYAFIASILPVTTLLQPRDYINAWQLIVAMGLIFLGVIGAGTTLDMKIVAPAYNPNPHGAPAMLPFLFITIACGAISGFHSLVSTGTTSKQVSKETDALPVGYGSMIMEAVLATLVLIAVSAGIGIKYATKSGVLTGYAAWSEHYSSWFAAKGLPAKLDAFVQGSANMIDTLYIPNYIAVIIIGVFVASFAGTTLDTATRLQRYIIAEFFNSLKIKFMTNKYIASFTAVLTAGILAFATGASGTGAMKLWPMFGAVNQLLAAIGLLVVSVYLKRKGGLKFLVAAIPCIFMLGMTLWAVTLNEINFFKQKNILLGTVNGITLILAVWMIIEIFLVFFHSDKSES